MFSVERIGIQTASPSWMILERSMDEIHSLLKLNWVFNWPKLSDTSKIHFFTIRSWRISGHPALVKIFGQEKREPFR